MFMLDQTCEIAKASRDTLAITNGQLLLTGLAQISDSLRQSRGDAVRYGQDAD